MDSQRIWSRVDKTGTSKRPILFAYLRVHVGDINTNKMVPLCICLNIHLSRYLLRMLLRFSSADIRFSVISIQSKQLVYKSKIVNVLYFIYEETEISFRFNGMW